MLQISASAIIEKNKLSQDGAWLVLLEINMKNVAPIRLVRNTDKITWRGMDWTPFPFDLDDLSEDSKGELPSLAVKVSNVTRALQYYLEAGQGGVGATVNLYVINSKHLDLWDPEVEENFEVVDTSTNCQWATFSLGAGYPLLARRPERRIMKNFCQFQYGEVECGVNSVVKTQYPTCQRTLTDCRIRAPRNPDGSLRYGGEPSIPQGGLYV